MNITLPAIECLACPIDGLPLVLSEMGALRCPKNHSYDRAKQGYFNLLPVQFKPSKDPGDSKAMIEARTRVLNSGIFDPVCSELTDLIQTHWPSQRQRQYSAPAVLVDAGCGDGYYTSRLAREFTASTEINVIGVDISKWAIMAAARTDKSVCWLVANNKRLPVKQGSAGVITSLFGFATWQPWGELQFPGQTVITVDASSHHLLELRALIYDEVQQHDAPDDKDALDAGYEKVQEVPLKYPVSRPAVQMLTDILTMTPHGKRANQQQLHSNHDFSIAALTIDVTIRVYRKCG
ncbi:MAG: methyltransferase domain-containing protein [Granulosicoccus sp.]|nr:methyltransferase domain-containing protein [Granulosicoccus sp.]